MANYKLIGISEDCFAVVENIKTGEIKKVTPPMFKHMEVVSTTKKHYSQKELTRLTEPTYTDSRGWVYGENYINKEGSSGGYGYWNEENLYQAPQTLELRIKAKIIELKAEVNELTRIIENKSKEVYNLSMALKI